LLQVEFDPGWGKPPEFQAVLGSPSTAYAGGTPEVMLLAEADIDRFTEEPPFDFGAYWENSVCMSCHLFTVVCALSGSPA
jgi:hypothetical protein